MRTSSGFYCSIRVQDIDKDAGLCMQGAATNITSLGVRHDLFPMVVAF